MSITGSNVSNMLCEFNINMSDIINGSASNQMKIAYTGFNALPHELWKCDMILELTDCIYGFSNCGLSYEEAKYCLNHFLKSIYFLSFFYQLECMYFNVSPNK